MSNDRLVMHTVHTDDGATEIYWGRAQDDMIVEWEGSLLFHKDGSITWKAWTDNEVPIVATIKANRITVAASEDQPPDPDEITFDSDRLNDDEVYLSLFRREIEALTTNEPSTSLASAKVRLYNALGKVD